MNNARIIPPLLFDATAWLEAMLMRQKVGVL